MLKEVAAGSVIVELQHLPAKAAGSVRFGEEGERPHEISLIPSPLLLCFGSCLATLHRQLVSPSKRLAYVAANEQRAWVLPRWKVKASMMVALCVWASCPGKSSASSATIAQCAWAACPGTEAKGQQMCLGETRFGHDLAPFLSSNLGRTCCGSTPVKGSR